MVCRVGPVTENVFGEEIMQVGCWEGIMGKEVMGSGW